MSDPLTPGPGAGPAGHREPRPTASENQGSGWPEEPSSERANAPIPAPSLWQSKPWWCQPWSILGTGAGVVAGSWWLLQRWWITLPLGLAVTLWWWLFLVAVPTAYRQQASGPASEAHDQGSPS